MSSVPPGVQTYVDQVATRLREALGARLVGVYLHGSAVLGDFSAGRSDVDVIAVAARPLVAEEKAAIAELLSESSLPCPAAGLEFHIVHGDDIASTRPPQFELHVATRTDGTPDRVVAGGGDRGDPDLVMHFAVLHAHGRALVGPAPEMVFPAIPRPMLLDAFRGELEWATKSASPSYQVLNACRAWRYIEEDVLCSKTAGGEWARERVDDPSAIDAALRHRLGLSDDHPEPAVAHALVGNILQRLEPRTGAAAVVFDPQAFV